MRRGTFLVADRNPQFIERTQEILSEGGFRAIAAQNGAQARQALRQGGLDAVLVHAELPELSGVALCKLSKERDPTVPVVVMFSSEDDLGADEALLAGADNFLVRPLKRTELLYIARDLMAARSALLTAARAVEERDAILRDGQGETGDRAQLLQFELFKRFLHIELKRSRRYGFSLSLLVASLDRQAPRGGREGLALAVRGAIRDIDIPVGFGQSDVLVVMPHTPIEGALLVGERICKRVRAGFSKNGVTASVGVVTAESGDRLSFNTLLAQATRARKQAHRDGGDRVIAV